VTDAPLEGDEIETLGAVVSTVQVWLAGVGSVAP